jgi:HPt (histidine-containing phosphotransfer) domain-containing protein
MLDDIESIEGINCGAALVRFGSEEAYISIIKSFVENTPPLLEKIKTVNKESLNDYAITIHGIKGSSKAIGAYALGDKAEELEYAAKSGRLDFCIAGNISFQKIAHKLIDDLRAALEKRMESKGAKEARDKPDPLLLLRLKKACASYEITEIDEIIEELEKYNFKEQNGLVKDLRAALDISDFPAAEKLLAEIT